MDSLMWGYKNLWEGMVIKKSDETIENIAIYLDRMNKHKSTQINQIDIDGATQKISELCTQNNKIEDKDYVIIS